MAGTPHLTEEYERGRILYRAGDESRRVGVILSGCLEIRKYMADGRTVVMFQRRRGEMLGGSIVFSSAARYPCDVTAKDKTEMLWIDRDDVLEKLMKNAAIARSVLRLSSDRIMLLEKRVELFSLYSIRKKIAFSLLNDFDTEEGAAPALHKNGVGRIPQRIAHVAVPRAEEDGGGRPARNKRKRDTHPPR